MMVISYIWGQRVYPVPYAWRKLLAYMVIVLAVYLAYIGLCLFSQQLIYRLTVATVLLGCYILFILRVEHREFQKLPVIGKYIARG